jgi:2'-5' RNA ligase
MPYRLFFAIWPDAEATQQIQQLFAHYYWPPRSKPVPVVDWHITLNFLGDITELQYQQLLPLISAKLIPAFSLTLDQLVYWNRAEALLLAASVIPAELTELVEQINAVAKRQQIKIEKRAYQPHLTLARRFPDPDPHARVKLGLLPVPVTVTVKTFCLADSAQRTRGQVEHYHILKKWHLQK